MKREFPRAKPGDQPTEGALDELLEHPPDDPQPGSLRAYEAASKVRRRIYAVLVGGTIVALVGGIALVRWAQHRKKNPTPSYQIAPGSEDEVRPRSLEWTSGFARLGLSRQEPGVQQIVLPDRIVRLADGCDHAQIKVNVVDGRTVELKIITGEIAVDLR